MANRPHLARKMNSVGALNGATMTWRFRQIVRNWRLCQQLRQIAEDLGSQNLKSVRDANENVGPSTSNVLT